MTGQQLPEHGFQIDCQLPFLQKWRKSVPSRQRRRRVRAGLRRENNHIGDVT
jgi:hypothetical protein